MKKFLLIFFLWLVVLFVGIVIYSSYKDAHYKDNPKPIAEGALLDYSRVEHGYLHKKYGEQGIERLKRFESSVSKRITTRSNRCDSVANIAVVDDESDKNDFVIIVSCGNHERAKVTESEYNSTNSIAWIGKAKEHMTERELAKIKRKEKKKIASHHADAEVKCIQLTKKSLKSPTTFKKEGVSVQGEWEGLVLVVFSSQNSFGAMLAASSVCSFDRDRIELLGINQR